MSTRLHSDYAGQEYQRRKSRDAARCRRGQQNDEFQELATQLPINFHENNQLDRLSIMRLTNSYVKIKQILKQLQSDQDFDSAPYSPQELNQQGNLLSEALDGFVFVVGSDGRCLYISDNVTTYLGLLPIEIAGNSFYKYIHPCDHEEVAKELCGKIPLEDMEIFDGLFCSDSVFMMSNNLKGGSKDRKDIESQPYRSFFVRIKSTLTSRGKNVNLKASTYRVVHCTGCLKRVSDGTKTDGKEAPICFTGIGVPLMFTPTFEVPLDQDTFSSHHSLDLTFLFSENSIENLLGYKPSDVLDKSMYLFIHGSDQNVLANCHRTLLTKGQSVSGYYRLLVKSGGWVWVQTKASIVYATKSCEPQFVLCVHYTISGIQYNDMTVSLDQLQKTEETAESPRAEEDVKRAKLRKNNKRLPVIQKTKVAIRTKKTVEQYEPKDITDNDCHDLSSMDLSDVCMEQDVSEICEKTGDYLPTLTNTSMTIDENRTLGEYLTSTNPPSPGGLMKNTTNEDNCAPFIPPPLGDTQFSVDEKELEMFNLNNPFNADDLTWKSEDWESCCDMEKQQRTVIKRNLSTPTFFPLAEKITPEP